MSRQSPDPDGVPNREVSLLLSASSSPLLTLPPPFHNTKPRPDLITQGAEGHVFKTVFLDPSRPAALKIRPSKPYRHHVLDQRLTKQRVLAEARVLVKLGNLGLAVPAVFALDWRTGEGSSDGNEIASPTIASRSGEGGAWLLMEWIEGMSVRKLFQERDLLEKTGLGTGNTASEQNVRALLRRIGWAIGKMHSAGGVVHGDLTTSNIMVRPRQRELTETIEPSREKCHGLQLEGEIVLIDFGLASRSIQDEDRAVDLYVLERAFGSTHPKQETMFSEEVLENQEGYIGSFKASKVVLERLEEVRLRGRKRSMVG